jgi:catechol 2,3-dioxygenase-like lactoylglutathione lyase family enzyme
MLGAKKIVAFVPVLDKAKARAFYEEVIGLRFINDDGFALLFDANGITVRVVKVQDLKPAPFTILGWEVEDIDTTVKALRERGMKFEIFGFFKQDELGIWTAPGGDKVAWFKDPDGNILSVSEHVGAAVKQT